MQDYGSRNPLEKLARSPLAQLAMRVESGADQDILNGSHGKAVLASNLGQSQAGL